MLKVFEAFSGYGSQTMALDVLKIPYEVVAISDIKPSAIIGYDVVHNNKEFVPIESKDYMIEVLTKCNIGYNFKKNKVVLPKSEIDIRNIYEAHIRSNNLGDISLLDPKDIPKHNYFTYSFPCTDISKAGKMCGLSEGSNTRSSLLWECKKNIEYHNPKYLLMENVQELISKKHKNDFEVWCNWLETQGYKNYYKVISGVDCNIPQNRPRVFMVSILGDDVFKFGEKLQLSKSIKDILDETNQFDNVISDKCKSLISKENEIIKIKQATKQGWIELTPIGICDLSYPTSKTRRGRVQHNGSVCPTLTATEQELYIVDRNLNTRKLTITEVLRLMGVRDNNINKLINSGLSNSELYDLAGNSIIVDVLVSIYKELFNNKY